MVDILENDNQLALFQTNSDIINIIKIWKDEEDKVSVNTRFADEIA